VPLHLPILISRSPCMVHNVYSTAQVAPDEPGPEMAQEAMYSLV
jgi:hypothetical protein